MIIARISSNKIHKWEDGDGAEINCPQCGAYVYYCFGWYASCPICHDTIAVQIKTPLELTAERYKNEEKELP